MKINVVQISDTLYKVFLNNTHPDSPYSRAIASLELSECLTYVEMVDVKTAWQRQGIATALYRQVEASLGYALRPSKCLTNEGQAFRASYVSVQPEIDPSHAVSEIARSVGYFSVIKIDAMMHL